jgi:hypothetical protein
VTSPRTYEQREIKPLRPSPTLTTRTTTTLLLLLLLLHALLLALLLLLSMFERVALLPVDDVTPNEHLPREDPFMAASKPIGARRRLRDGSRSGDGGEQLPAQARSSANQRGRGQVFEPAELRSPSGRRRAASIDDDNDNDDGPRLLPRLGDDKPPSRQPASPGTDELFA